jgi:hypothetical protein
VGPMGVSSSDAVRAWRELAPEQRSAAWAAARTGAAPPDAALAAVMVGYGLRRQRQLRAVPLVVLGGLLPIGCGATLLLSVDGVYLDLPSVYLVPAIGLLVLLPVVVSTVSRVRFAKLAAAGELGLEGARRGAVPVGSYAPLDPAHGFTVPYGVPVAQAAPPGWAPAVAVSGDLVELRARRGPVLAAVTILLGLELILLGGGAVPAAVVLAEGDLAPALLVPLLLLAVLLLAVLAMLASYAAALLRIARDPVTARFSPAGWELPSVGQRGPWSEIQAIEVRAFSTGGGYGQRTASSIRLVVLRVAAPQRYVGGGLMRRWALRRNLRRYGSPLVLAAGPRAPMELEPLLATLARFTAAPVHWT